MNNSALAIDIGSHSVKAVLLRRRGRRIQIVRAASAPLEELGHMEDSRRKTTKEAMIVRNLLRSAGIRPRPARVAVAGRKCIVRYTRVPPAPPWRLQMLIDYEIEGDSESGGKDLAYDFRVLDLPTSHLEFTVMMALARNDFVEGHCDLLREAGLRVDDITLAPFALFNTFLVNRRDSIEDDKTYLLVDIGSENLNVAVQRNGKLFFARNIAPGGRAFTEAVQDEFRIPFAEAEALKCTKGRLLLGGTDATGDETQVSPGADAPTELGGQEDVPAMVAEDAGPVLSPSEADQVPQLSEAMMPVTGRLASAIQSSLMYCRAQTRLTDLSVDEMVVTGGGARLPGLRQALSRRLGIPLAPSDPLRNFDLAPLRRESREQLEKDPDSYNTVIGLALGALLPNAVHLSLLPRKVKNRRRFLARTVYLWLAGAAMFAVLVLLGYSSLANTNRIDQRVQETDKKLKTDQAALATMTNLLRVNVQEAKEVGLLRDVYLSPRRTNAAFGALTRHVPPEVEITRMLSGAPKGGMLDDIIIQGIVLARIPQRGGPDRVVRNEEAHAIIGKLAEELVADPVFTRPPPPESVFQKEALVNAPGRAIAEFQLRLLFAGTKDDKTLGTK